MTMRLLASARLVLLPGLAALALALPVRAQTAPPAAPAEAPVTLPPYAVTGVAADGSVNPLTRPGAGIMGDARTLLDTPRAASTLTPAFFAQQGISSLADLAAYAPSSYAPSSYGLLTTPVIRGDTAEAYLNGQRLSYSNYGYLPSFNNVESADVVRGPGSVVFGAGHQLGGYVNYVTKRPAFDGAHTTVTTRLGTLVPGGGSFAAGSLQVDTTGPVNDRIAWRFSYEGQGGETSYRRSGAKDDRQDFFAALTWRPAPGLTVEANVQFFWQNAPELLGVNRITQALINDNIYLSGSPSAPVPVRLADDALLFSRGDNSDAKITRGQVIVTREASPTLTLINRTLYEHVDRARFNAFEYVEQVKQDTLENRTEAHWSFDALGREQQAVAGAALRYEGVDSRVGYFNVPDLGIPGNNDGFGDYSFYDLTDPSRVFDATATPGNDHVVDTATNGNTDRSAGLNPAVFWQQESRLTRDRTATVGLREDFYRVRTHDPITGAGGSGFADAASVSAFSQAYSLLWKARPDLSLYLTHNRIRSAKGSVTGGGVNLAGGAIDREDFRNQSVLTEAGAKADLLGHRLFVGAALFQQDRQVVSFVGSHDNIRVRGLELETVWQPAPDVSVFANATLQDGHYVNSDPFEASTGGGFTPGGSPGPGDWRLTGFSHTLLNAGVRGRLAGGWGAGLTAQWQSAQNVNIPVAPTDPQLVIPAQTTLNASLFYETPRWTATLEILNLANARNWIHNGDTYTGAGLISRELPLRLEARVTWRY